MDVGVMLPMISDWRDVAEWAAAAEALGFGSVWMEEDTGHASGLDPVVGAAALTRRIRHTRIGVLLTDPARPPAVAAKALATIDVLSGGRLIAGVGRRDSLDQTVAEMAEAVQVMTGLFGGGPFTFAGAYHHVAGAPCLPHPADAHRLVWVQGAGDAVFDLVATHAAGWIGPWGTTPEGYAKAAEDLARACGRAGRDPATVTRCVLLDVGAATAGDGGEALAEWEAVPLDTVIFTGLPAAEAGSPRHSLEMLARACSLGKPCRTSDPPS